MHEEPLLIGAISHVNKVEVDTWCTFWPDPAHIVEWFLTYAKYQFPSRKEVREGPGLQHELNCVSFGI